uniref:Uncharacterized protein n=1 Tax=Anguilla anguilla TaxID=7936 RepID=A0A0E9XJV2_ANGAN
MLYGSEYGVHSVSKTTPSGRNIQLKPCMQNSVKTYCKYIAMPLTMHAGLN